ncbi:MAG: hypothetical protein QOF73_664 [Thermomicrobiales bacterium]|jgi:hypothetical protein|nr:hypothetical protein [Thermomicrobiales bacterium]
MRCQREILVTTTGVQGTVPHIGTTGLPHAESLVEMQEKAEVVYQHVYDAYAGEGRGLYR